MNTVMCNREELNRSPDEQQLLLQLINEALKHPKKSRQYRKLFQEIIFVIQKSESLYKAKDILREYTASLRDDIYGEAFQRTCIEINQKLEQYDVEKASVMHWFNTLIKYRLLDVLKELKKQIENEKSITQYEEEEEESKTYEKTISDLTTDPFTKVEVQNFIECLRQNIQKNQDKLNGVFMRSHPNITAYILLLFLFPPYEKIRGGFPKTKDFAEIYNTGIEPNFWVELKSLTRFYRERCLPKLRAYVKECE